MTKKEYKAALSELEAGRIVKHNGRTAATVEELDFLAAATDAEPLRVEVSFTPDSHAALNEAGKNDGSDGEPSGYAPPDLPENPPIGSADNRSEPTVEDGEDVTETADVRIMPEPAHTTKGGKDK